VNWLDPDHEQFPMFEAMVGAQVIIQPGEVMYLPSYWGHAVSNVGHEATGQCNGWSGSSPKFADEVAACGFPEVYKTIPKDEEELAPVEEVNPFA
jgi:hypothetical protein